MRKCHSCLCRNCLSVCCDRVNCPGKKESCRDYRAIEQLNIFGASPEQEYKAAPRKSLKEYGIDDERKDELVKLIRSGRYTPIVHKAAYAANKDIAEYILLSVTENRSYEGIEYAEGLGRIPCGRTDFYGYRRLFYHLFDLEIRRI